MNQTNTNFLRSIEGCEFNFEDYGCVGIENNELILAGEVIFKAESDEDAKKIIDAYTEAEYGTSDLLEILTMEGF